MFTVILRIKIIVMNGHHFSNLKGRKNLPIFLIVYPVANAIELQNKMLKYQMVILSYICLISEQMQTS